MELDKRDTIIIGGGLGGLTTAILLAKSGRSVLLIEKKKYPFHRVCGEYISNEVKAFLQREGLFPQEFLPTDITHFILSAPSGKQVEVDLDLGGFGISRYTFDHFLYQKALALGVDFKLQEQVSTVDFHEADDWFQVVLRSGEILNARHVVGAFGKRSTLDRTMNRSFMQQSSPYIGIKYHIKGDFRREAIAIHHYPGGYCGLNPIENGLFNLCYLGSRQQLKECGSVKGMEERFLYRNPHLKRLFLHSEFLREKPEVINEVNFEAKKPVEHHILMVGDAAGLITTIFGNGMAIAIHSGKLAAEAILSHTSRKAVEQQYQRNWGDSFRKRLITGRFIQQLFRVPTIANLSTMLVMQNSLLLKQLMKASHGQAV